MSKFEVLIQKIDKVEKHPDADRLSLNYIGDYICVSNKSENGEHRYKVGDLVVYVAEGAVVPEYLLKQGYWDEVKQKGFLAASKGDRVKAIKLRGILSQGIIFPTFKIVMFDPPIPAGGLNKAGMTMDDIKQVATYRVPNSYGKFTEVSEGDDVSDVLGITKYEPEIPASMSGDIINIGPHNTIKYDIENLKKFSFVLEENEDDEKFILTEKLHGTFGMIGCVRNLNLDDLMFGNTFVASKGLGSQGLVFKMNKHNLEANVYTKIAVELDLFNKLHNFVYKNKDINKLIICGEVFGKGVQDLHYGVDKPIFRAFDVYYNDHYLNADEKFEFLKQLEVEAVPILAAPINYDRAKFDELASGKTYYDGVNVKEGVVITPIKERNHLKLGRVILKHINDAYLTRKGGTEFN